ncbi:FecR domain-containing protein [Echinicola sediminis]
MEFNPERELDFLENEYFVQWVLSPDEESERFWNRWVKNHPEKVQMMLRAKEAMLSFSPADQPDGDGERLESILDNVMMHHQGKKNSVSKKERSEVRSRKMDRGTLVLLAACASLVLFFTISYLGLFPSTTPQEEPTEWITKTTAKGAKSTFYLPDGTKVKLNSSSSLSFPVTFSEEVREVRLLGQGFFEVTRNEAVPFQVHTDEFFVKVLGTSFDVEAYQESVVQQVTVHTGKVAVETNAGVSELVLPNERVSLSADKLELIKTNVDSDHLSGWKDGIIIFEKSTYQEVFKRLEEWYGVDISIEKGMRLEGTFSARYQNESLENILKGVSYTKKFRYSIQGKKIQITP